MVWMGIFIRIFERGPEPGTLSDFLKRKLKKFICMIINLCWYQNTTDIK